MKTFFLEGYGCSLNISETEKIDSFLEKNSFKKTKSHKKADFIIINTCSVKQVTEQRMLSRIEKFFSEKKPSAKVISVGCLSAHRPDFLKKKFPELIVLDTELESICRVFKIKEESFSPKIIGKKSNKLVSIIPISIGCLSNCSFCATKLARPKLKSYSVKEIDFAFKKALSSGSKEIWLTSQDCGCYGFDIKTTLPELLATLLKNKGEYRIRVGMMNPNFFTKISKELLPLFSDERLYKFLHIPVQSGSDRILSLMKRGYKAKDFFECIKVACSAVPEMTFSTDIIVGFPTESRKDFEETLNLLSETKVDLVNISRFAKRFGTPAAVMFGQLSEEAKKEFSREISSFCKELFLQKNKFLVLTTQNCLVSEKTPKGFITARTGSYRPVIVDAQLGKFVCVKITHAFPNFFRGVVVK